MDLNKEIKGLKDKYNRAERLLKLFKSLEFLFTWVLPFLFLILVFGHQYGAIFLVPMAIIFVPSQIICKGLKEEKHEETVKIWSEIGDLERNERDPENENGLATDKVKFFLVTVLILISQVHGADEIDFVSIIKKSPATTGELGLEKLNKNEQAALNVLLNRAYLMGAEKQDAANGLGLVKPVRVSGFRGSSSPVYITKIDEENDDILKLENGAIVEITSGFLGFVGFRKDAVLYNLGRGWKIWIMGKRAYSCDILKAPNSRPSGIGESLSIWEVKGSGKILTTLDGSLYEVSDLNTFDTALWLGSFEALLIDGTKLLNLDSSEEIVEVTKIK